MANEVEEIKQRLNIVEIINEYLPLKKSGSNHKGVCPFHQEKTPSFMASQAKQIWHCFGCHKGGDIFSVVQEIEGIEFYDALKLLGDKAGVKIEKKERKDNSKKDILLEIQNLSAQFFHNILLEHPKAELVRDYIYKERGVSEETVKLFKLGYAPESWDLLLNFLKGKGYSQDLIKESGMVVFNEERKSLYDRFRNRLMIPLSDVYGNVVGFTARALGEDYQGGKYINSPQTLIYDKSKIVYGLHLAKQAIKEAGHAVVVEGNMDVVSTHQADVKQVVAVSGTAMTEAQLSLLKRFTEKLIFAFDEDEAGRLAMRRGVELALNKGFVVCVLELPGGKDPDEAVRQDVAAFKEAVTNAKTIFEVLINRLPARFDLTSASGKNKAALDVLSLLRFLPSAVERDHYVQKLALQIQISANSLFEELKKLEGKGGGASNYASTGASLTNDQVKASVEEKSAASPEADVSREIITLIWKDPGVLNSFDLEIEVIHGQALQDLYKEMRIFYSSLKQSGKKNFEKELFLNQLDSELANKLSNLELYADKEFADLEKRELDEILQSRVKYLKRLFFRRQLQRVQTSLKDAEQSKNQATIETLLKEFEEISSQLNEIS